MRLQTAENGKRISSSCSLGDEGSLAADAQHQPEENTAAIQITARAGAFLRSPWPQLQALITSVAVPVNRSCRL
jgi:hypothetical protein